MGEKRKKHAMVAAVQGGGTHGRTAGFWRASGKWVKGERGKGEGRGGRTILRWKQRGWAGFWAGSASGGQDEQCRPRSAPVLGSVLLSCAPFTGWTSGPEAQLQGALCASSKALCSLFNDFHFRRTLCSKPNVRALLYPKRFDVPTGSAP